jgi:hypothetical protein
MAMAIHARHSGLTQVPPMSVPQEQVEFRNSFLLTLHNFSDPGEGTLAGKGFSAQSAHERHGRT